MHRQSKQLYRVQRLTALLCALMLCVTLLTPAVGAAPLAEGTADSLTWSLEGGMLTIRGDGAIPDYTERAPAPWYAHRDSILRVSLDENITAIGDMAFYECKMLTMVSLPSSVLQIGDRAFAGCEALTTIRMPSVQSIGNDAFSRCRRLTDASLPDTLTTIGDKAFYLCQSLTYVCIPAGVTALGSEAFAYCTALLWVDVKAALTALPEWCFYGCDHLTAITLPASVTEVGDDTFTRCDALSVVYHSGTDSQREQLAQSIIDSLPEGADFTVSQMGSGTPPTVSGKDVITDDTVMQEITTEVTQKEDVTVRVEQTVTYPVDDNGQVGTAEGFDSTIHTTIRDPQGWDVLMDEINDQLNDKISFEQSYGEQDAVQAEVTLNGDTDLSGDWLSNLAGKDVVITITTPNGSRWSINGNHITDTDFEDSYPLSYTLTPYDPVSDTHKGTVGSAVCWWLSFDAQFRFPVVVEIFLDPYATRQNATLYENIPDDVLQKLQSVMVDDEGYVSFPLSVINKVTRYVLALNVAGIPPMDILVPDTEADYIVPPEDVYVFSEPRGFFGMTIAEFTRLVLIVAGVFVGVVLVLVLFFVLRSKRKAKIAAIRAAVMGTDVLDEYDAVATTEKKSKKSAKKDTE